MLLDKKSQPVNKGFFALLALMVIPISGMSIDIYVPSLPALSHYFLVKKELVQLSITAYMVGISMMQLFAGGISDSFGRKKPFLIAMFIYILATLAITFSMNIYQLLFLRFIQGIAIAVVIVPMRSVLPDLFSGRELFKMMSYMTMAWSLGPIIAPAIGGYLQQYFGWKANFYFLAFYSTSIFLLILYYLPETSLHRHRFHLVHLFHRYKNMLKSREYLTGIFMNGLLYSILILFAVVSPFLIQTILHYNAVQFGYVALGIGLAWFIGAMSNRLLIDVDVYKKYSICLGLMVVLALSMLLLAITLPLNLYTVSIPTILLAVLGGIIFPNNFAKAVSLFPESSGSANALFGAFVFLISGISSSFGTFLITTTAIPLAISFLILIFLSSIVFYINYQK